MIKRRSNEISRLHESDSAATGSDSVHPADAMPPPNEAEESRVVTSVRTDRRDPARVVIHVDGRREAVLPREIAVDELALSKGVHLTPELEAALAAANDRHQATRTAMNMLNRRSYSRGEMIERLTRRKGVAPAIAEGIADHLVSVGLINDAEYGRAVLRELTSSRPAGPALMRQRLRSKRIANDLIGRLVDEHLGQITQDETLDRLVERKLASMSGLTIEVKQRRLYGLLARRGFDSRTATDLIRRHLSADQTAFENDA